MDAYTGTQSDEYAAAAHRNTDSRPLIDRLSTDRDRDGPATAGHTHRCFPSAADEHRNRYTIADSHVYVRAGGKRHAFRPGSSYQHKHRDAECHGHCERGSYHHRWQQHARTGRSHAARIRHAEPAARGSAAALSLP
jgi:hypothetical protein